MLKCSKRAARFPRSLLPAFSDSPQQDDPHDAIHFELMSIALSVARLREIVQQSIGAVQSPRGRRSRT
jgi:hypothetical protein